MGSTVSFQIPNDKNYAITSPMDAWRIWLAILLLIDAGIGLLGLPRFEKFIPARLLTRIALTEAAIALGLVLWHFLR